MIMHCHDAITAALDTLSAECNDVTTVTSARGLLKRFDFEFIVCLHILQQVFQITGPCSRILQATCADMSITVHIIRDSLQKLIKLRADEQSWSSLLSLATTYSEEHDISAVFSVRRTRKPTRQFD